ncbi:MAG: hypothetical protein PUP92_14760, partial [Rhizonema sp. PD38]|nr:hypothetical protein [Rhizonema sp. PD38]
DQDNAYTVMGIPINPRSLPDGLTFAKVTRLLIGDVAIAYPHKIDIYLVRLLDCFLYNFGVKCSGIFSN